MSRRLCRYSSLRYASAGTSFSADSLSFTMATIHTASSSARVPCPGARGPTLRTSLMPTLRADNTCTSPTPSDGLSDSDHEDEDSGAYGSYKWPSGRASIRKGTPLDVYESTKVGCMSKRRSVRSLRFGLESAQWRVLVPADRAGFVKATPFGSPTGRHLT
jgi:hypothetical protein